MRVLIVDDEYYARVALQNIVSSTGEEIKKVECAASGREAIEKIYLSVPDVIFTDVRMADMDGIELCQWVNRHFSWVHLVIVSGFADFEYAQKAIDFHAQKYILKPIEAGDVRKILRDIRSSPAASSKIEFDDEVKLPLAEKLEILINYNYNQDLTLQYIAGNILFTNANYLSRIIKQKTGKSFLQLLQEKRLQKAEDLFRSNPKLTVGEVASMVGYNKESNFITYYKKYYGITPGVKYIRSPQLSGAHL